jgi:SAM-dependent methyltransferase
VTSTRKTDWDAYYASPYAGARVSRKISEYLLLRALRRSKTARPVIVELGGANSCFYDAIARAMTPSEYVIVDNNTIGLERFKRGRDVAGFARAESNVRLVEADLNTSEPPGGLAESADICFSVGLIEHFDRRGTERVVRQHFSVTKPGGLVVITFPTPTSVYRASRFVSESLGLWIFHDERPLEFAEVISTVSAHGRVRSSFINWPILFTQGYVIAEKA